MISAELGPVVNVLVSWLLTYWLHSTVLLGLTWLLVSRVRALDPGTVEVLWRVAIFGGIVSATLHTGLGFEPLAGHVNLVERSFAQPSATLLESSTVVPKELPMAALAEAVPPSTSRAPWWPAAVIMLWMLAATVGLTRHFRSVLQLRRVLEKRRPMPVGRVIRRLAEQMGLRSPVRLSLLDHARIPFATGVLRPEVCVPRQLATCLPPAELAAVVAHELAHIARRDPAWQMLYRALGALLAQPLNGVARRRLEEVAELLADDRAASASGRRRDLARSLLTVAEQAGSGLDLLPVTAALSRPGTVGQRVERLLEPCPDSASSRKTVAGLAWALVVGVMILVPTVSLTPVVEAMAADGEPQQTWSPVTDEHPAPPAEPRGVAEVGEAPPSPASPSIVGIGVTPPAPSVPSVKPRAGLNGAPPAMPDPPTLSADAAELQRHLENMQFRYQELREKMEAQRRLQASEMEELRKRYEVERALFMELKRQKLEGTDSERLEKIRDELRARAREDLAMARERRAMAEEHRLEAREEMSQARELAREAEAAQRIERQRSARDQEMAVRDREISERLQERAQRHAQEAAEMRVKAEIVREQALRHQAMAAVEAEKRAAEMKAQAEAQKRAAEKKAQAEAEKRAE